MFTMGSHVAARPKINSNNGFLNAGWKKSGSGYENVNTSPSFNIIHEFQFYITKKWIIFLDGTQSFNLTPFRLITIGGFRSYPAVLLLHPIFNSTRWQRRSFQGSGLGWSKKKNPSLCSAYSLTGQSDERARRVKRRNLDNSNWDRG